MLYIPSSFYLKIYQCSMWPPLAERTTSSRYEFFPNAPQDAILKGVAKRICHNHYAFIKLKSIVTDCISGHLIEVWLGANVTAVVTYWRRSIVKDDVFIYIQNGNSAIKSYSHIGLMLSGLPVETILNICKTLNKNLRMCTTHVSKLEFSIVFRF